MMYFRPALAVTLIAFSAATVLRAQEATQAPKSEAKPAERQFRPGDTRPLRTFYLKGGSSANDGNEILTALRLLSDPEVKLYLTPSLNAISVRASAEQIQTIETVLADLDRPRKSYRLTYTLTEIDGTKRIGQQNFAIVVTAGGRTTLKDGSKIPIVTGSNDAKNTVTQFTYLDIGLNIDASLDEFANGARLRSKIEQSSAAEEKTISGVTEPLIRQSVLEGTSFLTAGKPLTLGAFDIPGSTRHLEMTVVMEPVS